MIPFLILTMMQLLICMFIVLACSLMDMRAFLSVKRPRVEGVSIDSDKDSADEEAVPSLGSDFVDDIVSQHARHGNFDSSRDSDVEYDEAQVEEEDRIDDVEPNAGTLSQKAKPKSFSRGPSDISRTAGEPAIVVRAPRTGYPKTFAGQHSRAFSTNGQFVSNGWSTLFLRIKCIAIRAATLGMALCAPGKVMVLASTSGKRPAISS